MVNPLIEREIQSLGLTKSTEQRLLALMASVEIKQDGKEDEHGWSN